MLGGVVVYSNEAKAALAGVDPALIERIGAVSVEVAEALADGARAALGAESASGITGIAGPGRRDARRSPSGSSASAWRGAGRRAHDAPRAPARRRADVRDRSTTVALHLVRRLLLGLTATLLDHGDGGLRS